MVSEGSLRSSLSLSLSPRTLTVCLCVSLPTALFLANAINSSRFEAAHRMIDMLEKMSISKPNKRQLVISYGEDPPTPGEGDAKIT